MPEPVLQVKSLRKSFKGFSAVDDISFEVPRGQVVGLLGPNGAGKTTTINILCGITLPDSGEINYFGQDFASHRHECLRRINFMSSFNTLQLRISAWENLLVFSDLYGIPNAKKRIGELAEMFDLTHQLHRLRYRDLSTGQKTRVNLMKALLNDPELILMDEPTASLDPDIADRTLILIEKLRHDRQLSILYTSHDMPEVARICDDVIFLDHGRIVEHGAPEQLTKTIPFAELRVIFADDFVQAERWLQSQNLEYVHHGERLVSISTKEDQIAKLIASIDGAGLNLLDVEVRKPTLEDVFLRIARGSKDVTP